VWATGYTVCGAGVHLCMYILVWREGVTMCLRGFCEGGVHLYVSILLWGREYMYSRV